VKERRSASRSDRPPIAAALLGGLILSCAEPSESVRPNPVWIIAPVPSVPTDVLLVVDNACSMEDEQMRLVSGLSSAFDVFPPQVDVRIGVITPELDRLGNERTGRVSWSYSDTPPHGIDYATIVDGCRDTNIPHGCLRGSVGSTEGGDIATRDALIASAVVVGNCQVGYSPDPLEAVLAARDLSLSGDCNQGFFRPEANLVVVIVSDDDDVSPRDLDEYLETFAAIKGSPSQLRIAVLGGIVDGVASRCGSKPTCGGLCDAPEPPGTLTSCGPGVPSCPRGETCQNGRCVSLQWVTCWSCTSYESDDCCSAASSDRLATFATRLGDRIAESNPLLRTRGCRSSTAAGAACLVGSICDRSYVKFFQDVAYLLAGGSQEFVLSRALECPSRAKVFAVGRRFEGGETELVSGDDYLVDPLRNSIIVRGPKLPGPTEHLRVVEECAKP